MISSWFNSQFLCSILFFLHYSSILIDCKNSGIFNSLYDFFFHHCCCFSRSFWLVCCKTVYSSQLLKLCSLSLRYVNAMMKSYQQEPHSQTNWLSCCMRCDSDVDLNFIEICKECKEWSCWLRKIWSNNRRIIWNKFSSSSCTKNIFSCNSCWFSLLIIVQKVHLTNINSIITEVLIH
jgi:hypothetical protein